MIHVLIDVAHDGEDKYLFDDELVSQDAWEELAKKYYQASENAVHALAPLRPEGRHQHYPAAESAS